MADLVKIGIICEADKQHTFEAHLVRANYTYEASATGQGAVIITVPVDPDQMEQLATVVAAANEAWEAAKSAAAANDEHYDNLVAAQSIDVVPQTLVCMDCDGTGMDPETGETCANCDGRGWVPNPEYVQPEG